MTTTITFDPTTTTNHHLPLLLTTTSFHYWYCHHYYRYHHPPPVLVAHVFLPLSLFPLRPLSFSVVPFLSFSWSLSFSPSLRQNTMMLSLFRSPLFRSVFLSRSCQLLQPKAWCYNFNIVTSLPYTAVTYRFSINMTYLNSLQHLYHHYHILHRRYWWCISTLISNPQPLPLLPLPPPIPLL